MKNLINIKNNVICFETTGSVTVGGKLLLDNKFSIDLIENYPQINNLLANKLLQTKRNIPYLVGGVNNNLEFISINSDIINNNLYKFLLFSFPVKEKINKEINLTLKEQSKLIIKDYLNSLKLTGAIVNIVNDDIIVETI